MRRILPFILFAAIIAGCGDDGPVKRSWGSMEGLEDVVGNLSDVSYSQGRTQESRRNALNHPVHLTDFEGSFVWSEYAATWCPACAKQAKETKKAEKAHEDIVFLTVMTGQSNTYNDHATVETAKQWAGRHDLDPARTIAARLWHKTVPEHRFYSPEGHTLFVHVGFLNAGQIDEVIAYYRSGWEHWKRTGEKAEWMYFK